MDRANILGAYLNRIGNFYFLSFSYNSANLVCDITLEIQRLPRVFYVPVNISRFSD